MAQLMVNSGRSTLPWVPKRVVAVFQPHRYSRTAEFLERFAQALCPAQKILLAPLYSAGESPIPGINSEALAQAIQHRGVMANAYSCLDELANALHTESQPGDLVLVMGAGDVNNIWDYLHNQSNNQPLAAAA
jgi:UDP-N-acetylmuramate--alanine ligase